MNSYIDEKSKKFIIDKFSKELKGKVNLILFKDSIDKCPYCNDAEGIIKELAALDSRLNVTALENINIKSSMIEATEFPDLSNKYGVMAVPKIVINDKTSFEGAYPEKDFFEQIKMDLENE